jgi:hypothetical protein
MILDYPSGPDISTRVLIISRKQGAIRVGEKAM